MSMTSATVRPTQNTNPQVPNATAALLSITEDRPRYTNLLLLLRVGAELTATVIVAAVAFGTWGFVFWVGLTVALVMLIVCYVGIGVLPRTLGRQHPYTVGLALSLIHIS